VNEHAAQIFRAKAMAKVVFKTYKLSSMASCEPRPSGTNFSGQLGFSPHKTALADLQQLFPPMR
jgi:hypothetical protein